jgi:hypothetical protein
MDAIDSIKSKIDAFIKENKAVLKGIIVSYGAVAKLDESLKKTGALQDFATIKNLRIDTIPIYKTPDHLSKEEIIIF